MSYGSVHRITVSHLHHCCTRLTLHELNPLYVAIEAEDVEDLVSIDLGRLKAIHYKNWGVCMRAVLGGWWSVPRAITLATTTTTTYPWPHAVGRRGTVAVVIVAMMTSIIRWVVS